MPNQTAEGITMPSQRPASLSPIPVGNLELLRQAQFLTLKITLFLNIAEAALDFCFSFFFLYGINFVPFYFPLVTYRTLSYIVSVYRCIYQSHSILYLLIDNNEVKIKTNRTQRTKIVANKDWEINNLSFDVSRLSTFCNFLYYCPFNIENQIY